MRAWHHKAPGALRPARLYSALARGRIGPGPEAGLILALVLFIAAVSIDNPVFLRTANILDVLQSAAFVFIVAQASTFVLVGGGLDLSVGSVFAAGGLAAAALSLHGASPVVALVGGVAVGAGIGLINGLVIVAFRIPALIVTLGMTYIARGLAEVLTQAQLVPITDTGFTRFGEGTVGIVPIVVFYGIGIGVLAHIVLEYTRFGYLVRAVGGNAGAARSVGIKVSRVQVGLYVISGAAAGLSGTFTAARLHAGDPNIAIGYELTVLSAVIIGGTSLFGGVGTILGTALGAILLSAMTNGLIVINLNPLWQNVAVGVVIIAAVGIDQWRRRKSLRRGVDDEDDGLGAQFEGAVEPAVASS